MRNSGNTFTVNVDVKLPNDSIIEGELDLIHLHLGDLIKKTIDTRSKTEH
jgi:hypothetical protein